MISVPGCQISRIPEISETQNGPVANWVGHGPAANWVGPSSFVPSYPNPIIPPQTLIRRRTSRPPQSSATRPSPNPAVVLVVVVLHRSSKSKYLLSNFSDTKQFFSSATHRVSCCS
ncbi:hypothetical protein Droror1_Dr00017430 [Drosera rotundifolia]